MRSICSYCEILFDLKEPFTDDSETYGICPECLPWVLKNIEAEVEAMNSPVGGSTGKDLKALEGKTTDPSGSPGTIVKSRSSMLANG